MPADLVRDSESQSVADDGRETVGVLASGLLVGGLDHHAHERFGARGAQQHAPGVAEFGAHLFDRALQLLIRSHAGAIDTAPSHPAFVKSTLTVERTVEITYDKDRMNAGEVLALVQGQGYAIADVSTREADLEDVFLHLTSKPRE